MMNPLSKFAFNFNLRRYTVGGKYTDDEEETEAVEEAEEAEHVGVIVGDVANKDDLSTITVPAKKSSPTAPVKSYSITAPAESSSNTVAKMSYSNTAAAKDAPTRNELMLSAEYIGLITWFSIVVAPGQYYVASIGYQLEEKGDDDGFYTKLFTVAYSGSALLAPLVGRCRLTLCNPR